MVKLHLSELCLESYVLSGEDSDLSQKHKKDKLPKNSETLRALAHFSQIGVTMAASVLLGVLIGKYLDVFFGTAPWLLLIFSFLGVGAAIKALFNTYQNKK